MNSPDHLPYGIDKNRLRTGVAVGVLVIAAGLGFGSVMQTSPSSAEEPTAPVIDDTRGEDGDAIDGAAVLDDAPGTDADSGDAAGTSSAPISLGNDQPVADKGTVIAESSPSETDDAASKTNATQDADADKTDAEISESSQDDVVDVAVEIEATEDAQDTGDSGGEAEPDAGDDDTADDGETDGVEKDEDAEDDDTDDSEGDDASDDDASEDDDAKGKGKGKGLGLGNGLALGLGNGNGNGHGLGLLYPGNSLDELPPPSELDLPMPIDPPHPVDPPRPPMPIDPPGRNR